MSGMIDTNVLIYALSNISNSKPSKAERRQAATENNTILVLLLDFWQIRYATSRAGVGACRIFHTLSSIV